MVFETKKIKSETLGEYLKAVRTTFNLSLAEVSEGSGVPEKILEGLESGNMLKLPADVYVQGTLKQLAVFYKLSEVELLVQYKKERDIARQIKKTRELNSKNFFGFWNKLIITPKILILAAAGVFIVFTLSYLIWQVSSINRAPTVQIESPKNEEIINQLSVKVSGKTDPGSNILVNGEDVFVDSGGKFTTNVSLVPGWQDIKVEAKNRFGKQTQKSLKVLTQLPDSVKDSSVNLQLSFSGNTTLIYSFDSNNAATKEFASGQNFEINAKDKIIISAENGGVISALLNGQNLGLLGKAGEPLANVSFSKDSVVMPKQ